MGWACEVVHEQLGKCKCWRICKYGEYETLLGCLQVRYTDPIADGDGDGDGDVDGDDDDD